MKLAVNYSAPLIDLISEALVKVDLIKCPDWDGMLQEAQPHGPVTIHFDLEVGLGRTLTADLDRIARLKKETLTPHINTHLVTPKSFNPHLHESRSSINALWRDELQYMIDKFGGESVALEHYPYTWNNPHIAYAADSQVFSQIIQDTGCMLLLDLAHARITAGTLGIDVRTYIQSLPLQKLVEIHITGVRTHAGIPTDHFELAEKDWELLSWALNEIRSENWPKPEIIAFEYGGVGATFAWRNKYEHLRSQVPLLYELVHQGE